MLRIVSIRRAGKESRDKSDNGEQMRGIDRVSFSFLLSSTFLSFFSAPTLLFSLSALHADAHSLW